MYASKDMLTHAEYSRGSAAVANPVYNHGCDVEQLPELAE